MKLTNDEQRALAFIAALLLLSAAVRMGGLPEPVAVPTAGMDLDAHIAATERAVAEEERRARPLAEGETLDPNAATAAELDRLPGVGPAMAERIVEARRDGRFVRADDLTRVAGVGPRTVERLAPFLSLPTERAVVGRRRTSTAVPGRRANVGGVGAGEDEAGVIDLNTADATALATLSGIGAVLAERIVAYRDSAGAFMAVDSLMAVPGIGPATLERIRARVRVGR